MVVLPLVPVTAGQAPARSAAPKRRAAITPSARRALGTATQATPAGRGGRRAAVALGHHGRRAPRPARRRRTARPSALRARHRDEQVARLAPGASRRAPRARRGRSHAVQKPRVRYPGDQVAQDRHGCCLYHVRALAPSDKADQPPGRNDTRQIAPRGRRPGDGLCATASPLPSGASSTPASRAARIASPMRHADEAGHLHQAALAAARPSSPFDLDRAASSPSPRRRRPGPAARPRSPRARTRPADRSPAPRRISAAAASAAAVPGPRRRLGAAPRRRRRRPSWPPPRWAAPPGNGAPPAAICLNAGAATMPPRCSGSRLVDHDRRSPAAGRPPGRRR